MAKFCTNCGQELIEGAKACGNCGAQVEEAVKEEKKEKTVTVKATPESGNTTVTTSSGKTNGLAIAGFVTTLVSTLLCCGMFNLVGLILSIVDLVQAKNYDGNGKGFAIAGIVIAAVVMVLSFILFIVAGIGSEAFEELSYS